MHSAHRKINKMATFLSRGQPEEISVDKLRKRGRRKRRRGRREKGEEEEGGEGERNKRTGNRRRRWAGSQEPEV